MTENPTEYRSYTDGYDAGYTHAAQTILEQQAETLDDLIGRAVRTAVDTAVRAALSGAADTVRRHFTPKINELHRKASRLTSEVIYLEARIAQNDPSLRRDAAEAVIPGLIAKRDDTIARYRQLEDVLSEFGQYRMPDLPYDEDDDAETDD